MAKPALCLTFFALAYLFPVPFSLPSIFLLSHLSPTLASIILFFSVVGFFFVQLVFVNFLVEHNLSVCRTNDLRCMLNEVWAQRAREGMVVRGEGVGIVLRMKSWAWRGGREAVPEAV